MKKTASIILVATLLSLLGACGEKPEKVLIGAWTYSLYVSPAEAAKKSKESIPAGMSMEMSATGSTTYHVGGKYNDDADMTLRLRRDDKEVSLKFNLREAGVWEIHDNVLVETAGDSSVVALDEFTQEFLKETPQFKELISSIKGESTSFQLKEVSNSKIILEEKDSKETIVLQRKV
jgi:hypothetical protein